MLCNMHEILNREKKYIKENESQVAMSKKKDLNIKKSI